MGLEKRCDQHCEGGKEADKPDRRAPRPPAEGVGGDVEGAGDEVGPGGCLGGGGGVCGFLVIVGNVGWVLMQVSIEQMPSPQQSVSSGRSAGAESFVCVMMVASYQPPPK